MSNHTRYTASKRLEVATARAAKIEARDARWASLPFEDFLVEYREVAIINTPELIADARARHAIGFRA